MEFVNTIKKKNPLDFDWDCSEELVNLRVYEFVTLSLLSDYNFLMGYLVHDFCGSLTGMLLFLFICG